MFTHALALPVVATALLAAGPFLPGPSIIRDPGPPIPPVILYQLGEDSSYAEGCVGICDCPFFFLDDVTGQFGLMPHAIDQQGNTLSRIVGLSVVTDNQQFIKGNGAYRRNNNTAMQRMDLAVSINGGPLIKLSSGWVPIDGDGISLTVDNDPECFGHFLTISADLAG